MDRTITRGGSYSPWLIYWAAREAPWRLALLPLSLLAGTAYLLKLVSRGRLKEINHRLLMGGATHPEHIERRAFDFGERMVRRRAFADAVERIEAERSAGRRVIIATASYGFYVAGIAHHLGVKEVVATGSIRGADDMILSRLDGENCYGAEKLALVKAYFDEQEIERRAAHVRFFSDHHSDAPMFEWADEQVAINPTPKLRALAVRRGWRIERWA